MANKQRLNLSLTFNSASQKMAWQILQTIPSGRRTEEICRMICEWYKLKQQETLLRSIRKIVREELQNVAVQPTITAAAEVKAQDVSDDVLGFLRALQEGDGIG